MRKNRRRTARKTAKPKKKITFTGISARVMMSCAAALLLLSFLSVVADPAKAWFFTIFGLLFIPLFIVNLILFAWALKRRSKSFAIPVIALLPSIFFIGAYFQFPSSSRPSMPSDEESAVRIVTYNVGRFMQPDKKKVTGGRKACADSVRSFLASQDADIICLQEFYASDLKEVQSFAKGIGKGYRPEYYLFKGRYGYYGNVTFSRMKARDKGVVKFEDSANLAIYTDYSAGGRPFRVYNCHFESYNISMSGILRSVRRQDRDALKETEHKMRRGITRRPRQVNQVMENISKSPVPAFVCGDFNDSPMSYTYYRLSKGRDDSFRKAGEWFGSTFSFLWPLLRIDYVLLPHQFEALSHRIPHKPYSDHYPVVAEVSVEEQN